MSDIVSIKMYREQWWELMQILTMYRGYKTLDMDNAPKHIRDLPELQEQRIKILEAIDQLHLNISNGLKQKGTT